ncbi:MAG: RagB/SusD family nutrient uptake outer membrane protein [Odoribacter sp.]
MKAIYMLLLAGLLSSCDNFLDIVPVGQLIPKTVDDYEQMFNNDYLMKLLNAETFFGAPDYGMNEVNFRDAYYYDRACYIWGKQVFDENSISYSDWGNLYATIYIDNVILDQIGGAEGDELHRKKVIAEARSRRAFSYLLLVGIYAKQYDESTAATDLGVPLRLSSDVSGVSLVRSTVKEVYDFIETELKEAMKDLPDTAPNKFRFTKTVATSILARTYLMMMKYEDARIYADLALSENNYLYDYNTLELYYDEYYDGYYVDQVLAEDNDENYLVRYYQYTNWGSGVGMSKEFYDLFPHDGSDQRENLELTVKDLDQTMDSIYYNKATIITIAPTVPEMYLIRAEGYARKGDAVSLEKAMADINHLRLSRIVPDKYQEMMATTQDQVMEIVLKERRLELNIQGGLNWFDMKRLNKEAKYARKQTRTIDGATYTLEPNGNNYVMPIPYDVLGYNSAIIDNLRD